MVTVEILTFNNIYAVSDGHIWKELFQLKICGKKLSPLFHTIEDVHEFIYDYMMGGAQ